MLLAIYDVKYWLNLHDTGQFESDNDSAVLANSGIVELVEKNKLDLLSPSAYKSCACNALPYSFVGDEINPLKMWLMRPFSEKLNGIAKVFQLPIIKCAKNNKKCIWYFGC